MKQTKEEIPLCPLVKELIALVKSQPIHQFKIMEKAGVGVNFINILRKHNPRLDNVLAVLNTIGHTLAIVPMEGKNPDEQREDSGRTLAERDRETRQNRSESQVLSESS